MLSDGDEEAAEGGIAAAAAIESRECVGSSGRQAGKAQAQESGRKSSQIVDVLVPLLVATDVVIEQLAIV